MKKNLVFSLLIVVTVSLLLSGCFLMPKPSLEKGNYYLVTSFNDWSESPTILKNYKFTNGELTIDTSAHATFLYYVIKCDNNGQIQRYGAKDGAKVFAYGKTNSTFYIHPSMMKVEKIVGVGDNTKNDKDFYFHGALNSWSATKMVRATSGATLTYTATEVPYGSIEFKITVATDTWVNPQTFNGSWYGTGGNMKLQLPEDAATLTILFNPETDVATLSYIKSSIPLTKEYYIVGSFNGWKTDTGAVKLSDPDGDGIYTTTLSTTTKFATSNNNVVEYKAISKFKTSTNWYGAGNHFFSATTTSVTFYLDTTKNGDNPDYGTSIDAMDNLPLAVAGDFNGWSDTLLKIIDNTYEATLTGNFEAKDYGCKIKKPGTWDSYKYPDNNYTVTLSQAASEILFTFDPKTWSFSLTKVK